MIRDAVAWTCMEFGGCWKVITQTLTSPVALHIRLRRLLAPTGLRLPPDLLHAAAGGGPPGPGADSPHDPPLPQGGLHLPGQGPCAGRQESHAVPPDADDPGRLPVRRAGESRAVGHLAGPPRRRQSSDSLHQLAAGNQQQTVDRKIWSELKKQLRKLRRRSKCVVYLYISLLSISVCGMQDLFNIYIL